MNIKVIVAIAIALALLGGGAFFVLRKPASTDNQQLTTDNSQPSSPQSLRDLFASAVAQTCTFSDAESNSAGTVYVSEGLVRGDFEVKSGETVTTNHMIMSDNTIHFWQNGSTEGFKMALVLPSGTEVDSTTTATNQVDLDKEVDYSCSVWVADQSKFTLPADVTFTDPSAMMKGVDCSACDSVPEGTARTQCLTALKCN
ncbi:MAG: hypothetical protein AAB909_03015 [Patescibacteria group bacterium]|mgnify:CR=1 FL=1